MVKLLLIKDGVTSEKIAIPMDEAFTILIGNGAASDPVDIEIPSSIVSRRHASIYGDGYGSLFLTDLGSTNGTYLNNVAIPVDEAVPIDSKMIISFAIDDQTWLLEVESDRFTKEKTSVLPSANEQSIDQKSIFDVLQTKDRVIIGRNDDCDIVISDDTISRQHALIEKNKHGKCQITDLDSTNGIYVNGEKIHERIELHPDDIILIGDFRLSLKGMPQDIRNEFAIRAEHIVKQYPNGYVGLHETSITIPAQSLLAIMGPSGCGKSTLMKVLNGDDRSSSGRVYIHDLELTSNYEYLKPRIGYVPQDDIVHQELTVEESLFFAAKLRMSNPENDEIKRKIDQILDDLNIEKIRKSRVGKISGGQRKRVSIAVELLTDPLILFMDEPTSPLDPQTIEGFLDTLRRLSDKGTTVIMVTHKPEDLAYMDSVIFMAEGGHMVYYGQIAEYKGYFGVDSAVEVFAGITGNKAKNWIMQHRRNQASVDATQDIVETTQSKHLKTSAIRQYFWLTRRYFNIKVNDRINTAILLAQAPIIALLLCFIFQDIVPAVPFLISITAIWFGASNASREIVGELPIYRRERMFNLKIVPYIFSKLTVLTLFALVQAVIFIAILSIRFSDIVISDIDPVWNNSIAAIGWMVFLSTAATLMGLLLSAATSTTEKVMTLVPIVLIPQIILAGFIAKISNWGVEVFSWLTLARWGTEGFHLIQEDIYVEQTVINTTTDASGKVLGTTTHMQGKSVNAVEALNHSFLDDYKSGQIFGSLTNTVTLDALFVGGLGLIFFLLTWYVLRRKDT